MILGENLKVNLGDLFILAIEFVQLKNWVRLALRIGRVEAEFVGLAMLLDANFSGFLTLAIVEVIASVDSYCKN